MNSKNHDEAISILERGLSQIRPVYPGSDDPYGWNFGSARLPSYWAYGRLRALFALVEAERLKPKRVLEVAAGDGALCASLQHRLGCEVVANDLRADHLQMALKNFSNGEKVKVAAGNVFEMSQEEVGAFDLVVACEIIEHVAHGVDFLRQLAKFLSPTGAILLTTPNGSHFRNKLPSYYEIPDHSVLESQQFKPDADGHLFLIRPEEMHRMAEEAGLIVEKLDLWATPFVTGHGYLRLLSGLMPQRLGLKLETFLAPRAESLCFAFSAILRPKGQ